MDDYTPDTRVDEFIRSVALIGRAHNWDKPERQKTDKNGVVVLSLKTNLPVLEQFDDNELDKPSCYSGVKLRLFQALKGHPLLMKNSDAVIEAALRDRLRLHMSMQFQDVSTQHLESLLVVYAQITQGDQSEVLRPITKNWNVSPEMLDAWEEELHQQF